MRTDRPESWLPILDSCPEFIAIVTSNYIKDASYLAQLAYAIEKQKDIYLLIQDDAELPAWLFEGTHLKVVVRHWSNAEELIAQAREIFTIESTHD